MSHSNRLKGIKALVMGLGLHGGGVATTKWLVGEGAVVTVTDMRSKEVLGAPVKELQGLPVRFVLGEHRIEDFKNTDLVIVNPGVPRESKFLKIAKKAGKRIENDTSLFFSYDNHPKIAVTGTRGKSTTTLFLAQLLKKKYPAVMPSGNTPENALLREIVRKKTENTPIVAELSSWQLECLPASKKAPHIAVITNIFPDHLNRYKNIEQYANAKANIFLDQHDDDFLILNKDNAWTKHFLKKSPNGLVFYVSKKPLTRKKNGVFVQNNMLMFSADGITQKLFSIKRFTNLRGEHNLENLMFSILAVRLFDPTIRIIESDALRLSLPRMRQEEVFHKGKLTIINDSCATSPDGTIAAIKRFTKDSEVILITGGTDKQLEYGALALMIRKNLPVSGVILLAGSGTTKLQQKLGSFSPETFPTLSECIKEAKSRALQNKKVKTTILFSPGAASFEKFLHEFDRGEKFNSLIKKYFS